MKGIPVLASLLAALAVLTLPTTLRTVHERTGARPRQGSGSGLPAAQIERRGVEQRAVEAPGVEQRGVEAVAAALDLLALALRGGVGVVEAIEEVARLSAGSVAAQLREVSAAMRWGMPAEQAWASVKPVWRVAARAMVLSVHAGIPPAGLLARAADDLRQAERQRRDVATSRLGVRLVLPLGLAFLPAFVLTTVVPLVLALARQALAG